jgi:hypothetical protein
MLGFQLNNEALEKAHGQLSHLMVAFILFKKSVSMQG